MKIYIAGPMSGLEGHNYGSFHAAAAQLRAAGYEVENPAETALPEGTDWHTFMRVGITRMLTCDGVALLPGWHMSAGARLESHIARALGMRTQLWNIWIAKATY